MTDQQTDIARTERDDRPRLSELRIQPGHGVVLETVGDAHRFAVYAASQGMVPYSFRNKDGSIDTHAVVIALIKGLELGMKPMQTLQNIYVVNNQPTIYGDAVPGLAMRTGEVEHWSETFEGEGDERAAVCRLRRRGMDAPLEARFTVGDAKKAGLWEKRSPSGKPSPWILYPDRMLTWRARSYAFRAVFGDALKGLGVTEEVLDAQPVDVENDTPTVGQDGLLHALRGSTDPDTGEVVPDDAGVPAGKGTGA